MVSFDDFWKIYPLHVGKFTAHTAWDKALKVDNEENIINGEKRYIAWLNEPGWRPRPKHAATFLNQRCWQDEYTETARNGNSVLSAFDKLEATLSGAGHMDHAAGEATVLRIPARRLR